MIRPIAKSLLALVLLALPAAQAAPNFSVPGIVDETFHTGNGIISMRFDPAGRLWVGEKSGRILIFAPNTGPGASPDQGPFKPPIVFADLSSQVDPNSERGLIGLEIDPNFQTNRYVYVFYTSRPDQKCSRLTANADGTAMVPGSELVLIQGLPNTKDIHKAGDIHFHPKEPKALYIVVGDDGDRNLVKDMKLWNGKIYKISTTDGKGLPSNPFWDGNPDSIASRVWAKHFRNPFRFAIDPASAPDECLYVSENGDGGDRIVRIAKGADAGWPDQFEKSSDDGKRIVLDRGAPSKTGIVIVRSGPFAAGGQPTLYNVRYRAGGEIRRWILSEKGDKLTPVPEDNGQPFAKLNDHDVASLTLGPDGFLYYSDTAQSPSNNGKFKLGRLKPVGGATPVANFAATPLSGPAPLNVTFTDASTMTNGKITSWNWTFGDGSTAAAPSGTHAYAQPGIYTASLTVTNAAGLTSNKEVKVAVYRPVTIALTGQIQDARALPAVDLAAPTELRFFQSDGVTPLSFANGTGPGKNIAQVPAGGKINLTIAAQLTGNGIVVSAGEAPGDGVKPAYVGIPLTAAASQAATANFRLSDTMIRGRVLDTKGAVAQADIGLSRASANAYYAFAGGRDFAGGKTASGVLHRTVPDALGFYHIPVPTGGGGATFYLDTCADTLAATHGRVTRSFNVNNGADVVQSLTIGLYDAGQNKGDLASIAVTPKVDFATQIQPIFNQYCVQCHNAGGAATITQGLNLEAANALAGLVGKDSVEAPGVKRVEPGLAAKSYLMEKINSGTPQVGLGMMPGNPLPLPARALIRDWINQLEPANQQTAGK